MKLNCRLFAVAVACVVWVTAGCKKTYEDPTAFLEKYLIEDYVNRENPPSRVKALKLKGPELLAVHMGVRGIFNAACATVRYTPTSDNVVYVRRYKRMTWDKGYPSNAYGPSATVLSPEKLAKDLSHDVKVARAKSDIGVFVLVDKLSGSNTSIPDLSNLELLDKVALHAGLSLTASRVLEQKEANDRFFSAVENYMRYSSNGQLEPAADNNAIQAMADAFVHITTVAMKDADRFKRKIDRREFDKLSKIESVLRKKGAIFNPPEAIKGKVDAAVREERVFDAVNIGRFLFQKITAANAEREGFGKSSIWPHLEEEDGLSDDSDDIAGKVFKTSTEYFAELLDVDRHQTDKWAPYIEGVKDISLISLSDAKDKGHCDWIVLAGVTEAMPDDIPVLISANADYSRLPFTARVGKLTDEKIPVGKAAGRPGILWGDDFVVIVRKNGKAEAIKAADFNARALFGKYGVMQFNATVAKGNKSPRYLDVK